jgi:hypothetical protein
MAYTRQCDWDELMQAHCSLWEAMTDPRNPQPEAEQGTQFRCNLVLNIDPNRCEAFATHRVGRHGFCVAGDTGPLPRRGSSPHDKYSIRSIGTYAGLPGLRSDVEAISLSRIKDMRGVNQIRD